MIEQLIAPDKWPRYNQQFKRHQRSCHKDNIANDYCKLSNHQNYRGRPNIFKKTKNHKLNHEVRTINVSKFLKESNHTESQNKKTKVSATAYQPIINKIEEVKPQSEIFKLYLKQDELVKESIKLTQCIDSIKLKIGELENKVLGK